MRCCESKNEVRKLGQNLQEKQRQGTARLFLNICKKPSFSFEYTILILGIPTELNPQHLALKSGLSIDAISILKDRMVMVLEL